MKYPYLLFDADDTLFDFPQASHQAFSKLCASQNIPDTPEVHQHYHQINLEYWAAFDRGEITKEQVFLGRFTRFFQETGLDRDPEQCNREYLHHMGQGVFPLPHAEEVCQELVRRGHKLYIITNAAASVQRNRLKNSVFNQFVTAAFISEEAGAAKPDPRYYQYVFSRVPELSPQNTLVIGDSLVTDIRGANQVGLPCCWYNPQRKTNDTDLRIDYEIQDLTEILDLV